MSASRRLVRRSVQILAITAAIVAIVQGARFAARPDSPLRRPQRSNPPARATIGRLPLRFEQNVGQFDARVKYVARTGGATLFLTDDGATLSLRARRVGAASAAGARRPIHPGRSRQPDTVLTFRVARGRPVAPRATDALGASSNYFIGSDPSNWHAGVPSFGRVTYRSVLDGVDLVYHGGGGTLEYDFVVAPGADTDAITMEVDGAEDLVLTAQGDLSIRTAHGEIVQQPPRVYQTIAGRERTVRGSYRIVDRTHLGFVVAAFDRMRPLVIDPTFAFSTYLGGSASDGGESIATDSAGNVYVAGVTSSADFPLKNALRGSFAGGTSDVFVAKIAASGTSLVYSTYLGGSDAEIGAGVAVDGSGNAYVTGSTWSADFPIKDALYASKANAALDSADVFVAKLSPDGTSLGYSTCLGGTGTELGAGVAVDSVGNAYVTGTTWSADFPTANALYGSLGRVMDAGAPTTWSDAFVAALSASGTSLVYSTYLGGARGDSGTSVAVDRMGDAYVTGSTISTDFPTKNALYASFAGANITCDPTAIVPPSSACIIPSDVFVAEIAASGTSLVYSTYLGGTGNDESRGLAVGSDGTAYFTGTTGSSDFPVANALSGSVFDGNFGDAFVAAIAPAGTSLVYSTFLGGSGEDRGDGIAVDAADNAYVVGHTTSTDFPTQNPLPGSHVTVCHTCTSNDAGVVLPDAFVTAVARSGRSMIYSTTLGGTIINDPCGIAVDGSGAVYVTGFAGSLQEYPFPTKDALFASAGGGGDAFVSKLVLGGVEETANPDASDGPNTGASTPDAGCGCDISRQRHSGGACVLAVLAWAARGRRTRRRRPAASL